MSRHQEEASSGQPRAVLWDMDGTLLDSREYHWLSWRDALAAENYELTYDQFIATFGQRNDAILRGYFGEDLPDSEVTRISDAKETGYRELVRTRGIELLPGVAQWLERLQQDGWRQAVASSAPRKNVETIVEVLELQDVFATMVTAEDVEQGKPAPDVFLTAAEKLGVPPARCIVVEDAPAGVEAAHRAGMCAIGVRSSQDNLEADRVVQRLDELPDDVFEQLLNA
ncbi:MAG: HAD family hydrolase [Chloroflexaceae bacterium]